MRQQNFSNVKICNIFYIYLEKAENFVQHFSNQPEDLIEIELKKAFSKYTNDVITSCALGVECNSLKDETNTFYKAGSSISKPNLARGLRGLLAGFFPKLFEVGILFLIYLM